jgi:hypothetical protein
MARKNEAESAQRFSGSRFSLGVHDAGTLSLDGSASGVQPARYELALLMVLQIG